MPVTSANSTSRSVASALMMPPCGDDQRTLGLQEEAKGLLGLGAGGARLVDRQRLVGLRVELDLGQLDVDRQVDEDRAGTAGAHQVEGLLEDARDLRGLQDRGGLLGDGLGDRGDVDGLEVLLVELRDRGLARDAEDRDRVGDRRVQAGDHVGAGRAGRTDADTDVAGLGTGVALGHVGGALDVAGQRVADAADVLELAVEGVDRRAGHAERGGDAFALEDLNGRCGGGHTRHGSAPASAGRIQAHRSAQDPGAACFRNAEILFCYTEAM